MESKGTPRPFPAEARRQERAAQKRQRELERQLKEQAKLSAVEQARLEVEAYDNQIELLLSVHKECGNVWDWRAVAASLPPPRPEQNHFYELRARQTTLVQHPNQQSEAEATVEQGRLEDQRVFRETCEAHENELARWETLKDLAHRILDGEHKAYTDALVDFSPITELSSLGSSIHFCVHDAKTLECTLKVNGDRAIPQEVKTLTAKEKLSVKSMPRNRFHEIYHDHVAACVLRVAREVFALLPVEILLITASADSLDTASGRYAERPVLSVLFPRSDIEKLDFDHLDPSDATETFQHRGKFKATRKAGSFESILPLTIADIRHEVPAERLDFAELLEKVKKVGDQIRAEMAALAKRSEELTIEPTTTL